MKIIVLGLMTLSWINLNAQELKIAVAANLRYVLEDIRAEYAKLKPKVEINITAGSSGTLYQQILNGANYDLFMSADMFFPNKLKSAGAANGEVCAYAYGKLALWSNTIDLKTKGMNALLNNAVKRIAVAKPELAPYGGRAIECLKYYDLYDKVKDKIVFADNIAQAALFAQSGNAEVGFLALSLVTSPEMKGSYILPDPKSYKPVEQGMVLIKSREYNPEAKKFFAFILSKACHPIFEKYGFILPADTPVPKKKAKDFKYRSIKHAEG